MELSKTDVFAFWVTLIIVSPLFLLLVLEVFFPNFARKLPSHKWGQRIGKILLFPLRAFVFIVFHVVAFFEAILSFFASLFPSKKEKFIKSVLEKPSTPRRH